MSIMKTNSRTKLLISSIGGAVFALSAQGVLAQAVSDANTATVTEEVVVTGVRRALETALDVKRNSSSIVDHISAEDIGSLPALDLGEALQSIPGIQLNAEGGDRGNEINLRGLPGGFVFDTTNGMNIASVGLSRSEQGVSNPFGTFEPSIFRGATVVKSPTADLPAGGIAGYIDKQLPKALSQKRDSLSVNIGTRYEQLADNFDPEISVRANKMLIEDVLAVSGTYARSTQRFRRDSINFTRYENLLESNLIRPVEAGGAGFGDLEAYRDNDPANDPRDGGALSEYIASVGLPADATIQFPAELRQFSERSDGTRESLALNIEWQVSDNLKLGADYIGSQRELSDNRQDVFIFGARGAGGSGRNRENRVNIIPTPGVIPFLGFSEPDQFDPEGNLIAPARDVYILSDYSFSNAQYFPGNRDRDLTERTQGLTLSADWETDEWSVSVQALTSESETFRVNAQFDSRYNSDPNSALNDSSIARSNGITGRIFTGDGNLDDLSLVLTGGTENLDLNLPFNYDVRGQDDQPHESLERHFTRNAVVSSGSLDDGNNSRFRTTLLVAGGEFGHDREVDTFRVDVERALDVSIFENVKFGVYTSKENFTRFTRSPTPAFVNLENISNDFLRGPEFTEGNDFFEGNLPGFLGPDNGWVSLDVAAVTAGLTPGIQDRYDVALQELRDHQTVEDGNSASDALTNAQKEQAVAFYENIGFTELGFLERQRVTDNTDDFSAEATVTELYLMTDFSGEIAGSLPFSGNIGVRYAKTENKAIGTQEAAGSGTFIFEKQYEQVLADNEYENVLPVLNIAFDLRDDLVLRAAYYQGIVRPNAAAFSPTNTINEQERSVRIDLSDTEIEAFEADSFDLTLSWYNRAGSVFSIGYFYKDLLQFSTTQEICPTNAAEFGLDSTLTFDAASDTCFEDAITQVTSIDPDTGLETTDDINRIVRIVAPAVDRDSSILEGLEATIQQNLDFLPEPWSNLGGQLNIAQVQVDGDRIANVSELSYNLITYYETEKFSARLAYNFRDDYLLQSVGTFNGTRDRDAESRERLDLSLSYKFTKDLRVTLRGFNLLNDTFQEFQSQNQALPRRTNYDGRIYSLSANMKF